VFGHRTSLYRRAAEIVVQGEAVVLDQIQQEEGMKR
jgi:hypothetical protein